MATDATGTTGTVTAVDDGETAVPDEAAARPSPSPRPRDAEPDTPESADTTDTAGTAGGNDGRAPRSKLHVLLIAVLLVVCVALLVAGTLVGLAVWRGHQQDRDRAAATEAARAEVVNILTIDPNAIDAGVQRILDGATGPFKEDFASRKDVFSAVVKEQNVTSTGEVKAIAVESASDGSASLLVAATSTVTNAESGGQPQPRDYRMRVQVQEEAGQWLVAQVEFVP